MAKVEFHVCDPKAFESGLNIPRERMTYGDTAFPVIIDTESALIECEALNKSATIKDWVVDFEAHKMKLASEATDGNYREIDFGSAMGMIGQLAAKVGVATLQKFLCTLGTTYVENLDNPVPLPPQSDMPTENLPEDSKESGNPNSFDEV